MVRLTHEAPSGRPAPRSATTYDRAMQAGRNQRSRVTAVLVAIAVVAGLVAYTSTEPVSAYPGARWFKPSTAYSDNFPDPSVVRDGNTFYAFGTSTGGS